MGARFAPGVAQLVTWLIVYGITASSDGDETVTVVTMLDNVRLASASASALARAYHKVLARCKTVGITINDHVFPSVTPIRSLGEWVSRDQDGNIAISVCPQHAELLQRSLAIIGRPDITRRQLASIIGLAIYCAAIFEDHSISLRSHFGLFRAYAALFDSVTPWDAPIGNGFTGVELLARFITAVVAHPPEPPPILLPPPVRPSLADYDAIVIVDACASGWAAYVVRREGTTLLRQRFASSSRMGHSAHAEPLAAKLALQWVAWLQPAPQRVAVVTDHLALATAQRRRGIGGQSTSFYLNDAFRYAYTHFVTVEFFHLPGAANPADAPSRMATHGHTDAVVAEDASELSLDVSGAAHPYATEERAEWMV